MTQAHRILHIAAVVTALATVFGQISPASAATFTDPVTIAAEVHVYDLPPLVLEASRPVGGGLELDVTDEVANPEPLAGSVTVDIDPDTDTITVEWARDDDCFSTIDVVITSLEIATVEAVADFLVGDDPPFAVSISVDESGVIRLHWGTSLESCWDMATMNKSIFSFNQPLPPTTVPAETTAAPEVTLVDEELPATGAGRSSGFQLAVAFVAIILGSGTIRATRRARRS